MKAVLFISHGSRSSKSKEEVQSLISRLKSKSGMALFESGFLEQQRPTIPEAIDACVHRGATEILVLLNFLNSGKHLDEDIPRIVHAARQQYPGLKFTLTQPIGRHPEIGELFLQTINENLTNAP